jgi:hypothetical protein
MGNTPQTERVARELAGLAQNSSARRGSGPAGEIEQIGERRPTASARIIRYRIGQFAISLKLLDIS